MNNDRMSNLTQPGASVTHGANLTYPSRDTNNSVSNYYLSAAEDTLTLSACSGPDPAALGRELETALFGRSDDREEEEGRPTVCMYVCNECTEKTIFC